MNPLGDTGDTGSIPCWVHPLEEKIVTLSSVLAWRIPGMEEPGRLLSMGLHRVGHYQSDLVAAAAAPYYASILNQMMAQGLIWPT